MMENKERGNAMGGGTNTIRERMTQTRHEMRSMHCKRAKQKRESGLHNPSASSMSDIRFIESFKFAFYFIDIIGMHLKNKAQVIV